VYIGTDGVRHIECIEGAITKEKYLDVLVKSVGKRPWRNNRVWQQDNATAHSAASVRKWLQANVGSRLEWPANSPDLSPIDAGMRGCKRSVNQRPLLTYS